MYGRNATKRKLFGGIIAVLACVGVFAGDNADAVYETLTEGWKFAKDPSGELAAEAPGFDDAAWETVRVPHDWAIRGPFVPEEPSGNAGKLPWKGVGWYRNKFSVPEDGRRLLEAGGRAYLEFDGVMAFPQVWVNGSKAGGWDYGYMSFTLDTTKFLKGGENLLAVRADTRSNKARFYCGAGLYRRVRLTVRPAKHVLPGTMEITTPLVSKEKAAVNVACETTEGPTNFSFTVVAPELWDTASPALYTLDFLGEKFRYGIRTIAFPPDDGFHLNGRRVQLKGANLHSDLGLLGMAFDKSAMRRQLALMKEMGVNAIRTSHNPPAPEMLDLCDEMGLVVWDEGFDKWDALGGLPPGAQLEEYVARNLRALVRRDRNHPSVIIWSMANEIWEWDPAHPLPERGPEGQTRARNVFFREQMRLEDKTRPIGNGNRPQMNEKRILDMGLFDGLDITGWNYWRSYAPVKKRYPDKPVVYSESASAVSSYGFYEHPLPDGKHAYWRYGGRKTGVWQVDSRDLETSIDIADVEFDRMENDRYCCGEFVWTGIDYLGEPIPYDEDARSSYFGCVDLTLTPKDRFWLYRSHWLPEAPTLHVTPHWTWPGMEGRRIAVFVYTDGDEAELFVNGKSCGRRRKGDTARAPGSTNAYYDVCGKYRLQWFDVVYEPGELKAVSYREGRKTGEKTVCTAGRPVALASFAETPLTSDPEELAWVRVEARDSRGIANPMATNRVSFKLEGPGKIVAVGNGDPHAFEVFTDTDAHTLFFGRATAIIRRFGPGEIRLAVSSPGLASGFLKTGQAGNRIPFLNETRN